MKLTVIEDGVRADLDLDQPVVTIGRALDNDLRLQSSRVSRHHTRLETSDGESGSSISVRPTERWSTGSG